MTKNYHRQFSPEFQLLLQLVRQALLSSDQEAFEVDLPDKINWNLFINLLTEHRVVALAHSGIVQSQNITIPESTARSINTIAKLNRDRSVLMQLETVRMTQLFNKDNICVLPIKGATIARAYPAPSLRQAGDIDILLINESQILEADKLIQGAGYTRTLPEGELRKQDWMFYVKTWKDLVYVHKLTGIYLELHFRLFKNPELFKIDTTELWNRKEIIQLSGKKVPALAKEDALLYAIVHGAYSQWRRLKWLCDIPILLNNNDTNWKIVCENKDKLQLGRMTNQTMELSENILGISNSKLIDHAISNTRSAGYLVRYVEKEYREHKVCNNLNYSITELLAQKILYRTALKKGFKFKFGQINELLYSRENWQLNSFPKWIPLVNVLIKPIVKFSQEIRRKYR